MAACTVDPDRVTFSQLNISLTNADPKSTIRSLEKFVAPTATNFAESTSIEYVHAGELGEDRRLLPQRPADQSKDVILLPCATRTEMTRPLK